MAHMDCDRYIWAGSRVEIDVFLMWITPLGSSLQYSYCAARTDVRTDGADGRSSEWVLGSGGGAVAVFGTFQEHVPDLCVRNVPACYLGNSGCTGRPDRSYSFYEYNITVLSAVPEPSYTRVGL